MRIPNIPNSPNGHSGRPTVVTDPLGFRTTMLYDARGRVKATIYPLGQCTTQVYDALGNQVATINPLGQHTSTVYDKNSRPVAVMNPLGSRTTTVFDTAGQAVALTSRLPSSKVGAPAPTDTTGQAVALILARGGSKALPGKHLLLLGGIPLLGHVVRAAQRDVADVYVSTNDHQIARTAAEYGAGVIDRPEHLAQDESRFCEAVFHAVGVLREVRPFDVVFELEGSTILLREGLIRACLDRLATSGAESVKTVVPARQKHPDWSVECGAGGRIRYQDRLLAGNRQGLRSVYHLSGACRCTWRAVLERAAQTAQPGLWWDFALDVAAFEIAEADYVHVDTPADLEWARYRMAQCARRPQPNENHRG